NGLRDLIIKGQAALDQGLGTAPDAALLDRLRDAGLNGNLTVRAPDLASFRDLVPGVLRLGGQLVVDVELAGTAAAPEPSGRLEVDDFRFRLEGDLPGLDKGVIKARFDPKTIDIERADGQIGFSPLAIRGTVAIPRAGNDAAFDLVITGENTLLARSRYLRVRSDLDLKVTGPLSAIKVQGEVRITDALYTQPMSIVGSSGKTADREIQLFSFREPPLSDLEFDITILANRTVILRNNMLDGEVSTDLRLLGTGAVPRPDGRVTIDTLRVSLPFSKLDISRGTVYFDRGNPFSPRLDIAGNTRMQGFEINLLINGRMPDQTVTIITEPYMPQEDALFLLTVGATRSGLEDEGLTRAALTRAGSLISDSVLSSLFGPPDPDKESFGDRFELSMGRDISQTGQPTVEMEYKLVEQIFLKAERDRYDDYNLGAIWRLSFK
ncbi:MAG: translocation/assembly module TamB domain-containing protein, partial [Salinibacterium sp.]|nr:translocation/assembly module TamB domain-containing protein [Salinibacterium sp.]